MSLTTEIHLVEVDLHYYDHGDGHISARLTPAFLDARITLSVLHEQISGQTASGDIWQRTGAVPLELADGESLTVLARREGAIIAAGVFEVSQAATTIGLFLLPRATSNLLLNQLPVDVWQLTEIDATTDDQEDGEEEHGYAAGC